MIKKFKTYLENLGIGKDLMNKIERHYSFYKNDLGIKIEDIFVSETINKDSNRVFLNLWFFNKESVMEVKNFNTKDDYDQDFIKNMDSWTILKTEYYDINNPTIDSRCNLSLSFGNRRAELKASKENCKILISLLKKILNNRKLIEK